MGQFGKYEHAEDIPEDERKYYALGEKLRPIESIEFVDILFNKIWPVKIPKFLHDYHDWWDYWEIDCHLSMRKYLKPGMVLYDVGSFDGWQSAVFSQMVGGPKNIVMIEPCTEQWSNARLTWEKNGLGAPLGTYHGFVGNEQRHQPTIFHNSWPSGPDYTHVLKGIKFKFLHDPADKDVPCIRLDQFAANIRLPDALHIDIEGAELEALRGAEKLLRAQRPIVWVAIHPEFMRDRFKRSPRDLHFYMDDLDYTGVHLATDHEEHWVFLPDPL